MAGEIIYRDIAPFAAADAEYTSPDKSSFSDMDLSDGAAPAAYITTEHNAWALDGSYDVRDAPVRFWSSAASDDDGYFDDPPGITVDFTEQHSSLGITLIFDTAAQEYISELNIKWYQGATLKADSDFSPTGTEYFCEERVTAFDKVVITLLRTSLPGHFAKLSQVIFGITRRFGPDEIRSASAVNEMDLLSAELPASQLNWMLDSKNAVDYMFQLKQPVELLNGSTLLGVYYVTTSARLSASIYQITAYDAIGVLGEQWYDGGAFLSGASAKALIAAVVDGAFPVTYAQGITDKTLYGVILRQTKRQALQQILFAAGWCCRTDGGSDIKVFVPGTVPADIGPERTYVGAQLSTAAIVTQINVTVHTYAVSADGQIEIGGVKYSDTQAVYTYDNPDVMANDIQNVIDIKDATLVSTHNVANVAQRVHDHYLRRNTHKSKIIMEAEQLGDCVTQPTPWGTTETGNIRAMTITLSGIVAADVDSLGVENPDN